MNIKREVSVFFLIAFIFLAIETNTTFSQESAIAPNTTVSQEREVFIDLKATSAEGSEDGENVVIWVEITNEGNFTSDNFKVTAKGPEETWVPSEVIVEDGLYGGETRTIDLTLGIPEEYPEGKKAFEVEVDPEGESGDINYENNRFTVWVTFPEKKPDLVINGADAWVSEDENSLIFEVNYSNEGNAPANEFLITVGNPEEGWDNDQEKIAILDSGVNLTARIPVSIPEGQQGKTLAFRAEIDPENEIDELDEENNLAWTQEVFIPRESEPELTIWSVNALVSEDKDSVLISTEIANEGNADAGSFLLYAGNPGEGWGESQAEVSSLNSGESTTIENELEIPDEQREKEVAFRVIVDPENKIGEVDEENNIKWTADTFIPSAQAVQQVTETPGEAPQVIEISEETPQVTEISEETPQITEILGETPHVTEMPYESPQNIEISDESIQVTEVTGELPLTPDNDSSDGPPWKLIMTITFTVSIGGLLTVSRVSKIRRHTTWENKAVEETPEKCEPHTEFCLKLKPKPRKITRLSLNTYDSESGNKIKKDVKGEIIDDLNEALMSYYINGESEVEWKKIESISSKLLEEIKNWLGEKKAHFDVSVFIHLEGSEVKGQYIRYCCEQQDRPVKKEEWKKTFKDREDKEVGTLTKLDLSEPTMTEKQISELTKMLAGLLENVCKCPWSE